MKLRDEMARYGRMEREKALAKGMEKGMQQGKMEAALEMLKGGMAVDLISKFTKLPVSDIENLAKKNHLI